MTNDELKSIGLTARELSDLVADLREAMEADKIRFAPQVMTPDLIAKMTAIRGSNGEVDLTTIDVPTALVIKTMAKLIRNPPPVPDRRKQ
jgi:hypothetical protein